MQKPSFLRCLVQPICLHRGLSRLRDVFLGVALVMIDMMISIDIIIYDVFIEYNMQSVYNLI